MFTDFAKQIKTDYLYVSVMYIAIMPNDGQYDLEVEIEPETEIGGTFRTDATTVEDARKYADQLEEELKKLGISIEKDRKTWAENRDFY